MKATTLLKKDHAVVKKLFRAYEKADKSDATAQKKAIFDQIAAELDVHMKVEEEILYPALKKESDQDGVDKLLEAHEEHGVVKTLLAQLAKMKPGDETFDAKVAVVIESVEHHVGEEEEEMFPDADETLGLKKLQELGERIEHRKSELFAAR
ncbi:MAG: hemerythrin domain-containing protein [Candidatus Latescibacteria bacterium]|nr:hemerythrin domain-containing protein [Candidatus Latescibacterota bacterium]